VGKGGQILYIVCGMKVSGPTRARLYTCLLLALVTSAVYWPVLRNGFVSYDDPDYVTMNGRVQAGLNPASASWAFRSTSANWHPLTWLSHMLDCSLYGLKPAGHHLTNLFLHTANSMLVFLFLAKMTGVVGRSAVVAALFALHPLHVESVAWIAERKDVLSAFFGLLTLLAYAKYSERLKLQRDWAKAADSRAMPLWRKFKASPAAWYFLTLAFFACGLMSKPMLVTWPFVLLLLDFWPLGRFAAASPKRETLADTTSTVHGRASSSPSGLKSAVMPLVEKIPFFVLSAVVSRITYHAQEAVGTMASFGPHPLSSRITNAVVGYGRYLEKTFWPTDLAVLYPYHALRWSSPQVLASISLLTAITTAVICLRKKQPFLVTGWFWFIGTLVPVIGLVQVGAQAIADRYTYLPHIGLFIAVVWGLAALAEKARLAKLFLQTALPVILAGLAIITSRQLGYWKNSLTLFRHAAAVTEGNYIAHNAAAAALCEDGKLEEALVECRQGLQIWPGHSEAYNTLGGIYLRQKNVEQAIACYQEAQKLDPTTPNSYYGLALVYLFEKRYQQAEEQSREALRRAPDDPGMLSTLGKALQHQGKLKEAADIYEGLLRINARLASAHRSLGNALQALGQTDSAIVQYELFLAGEPNEPEARAALGVLLLKRNRGQEAEAQFREAVRLQPANSVANSQLALIHQARNEMPEAVAFYRASLKSQPDSLPVLNNLAWILAVDPNPALRNGIEAVTLAERACELTGYTNAVFEGTLAAAYAEAGRFDDAIARTEKSRALALANGQAQLAERSNKLLELFKAGKPVRMGQ
jgi:tetratricopeptide (TPR) repeat protein